MTPCKGTICARVSRARDHGPEPRAVLRACIEAPPRLLRLAGRALGREATVFHGQYQFFAFVGGPLDATAIIATGAFAIRSAQGPRRLPPTPLPEWSVFALSLAVGWPAGGGACERGARRVGSRSGPRRLRRCSQPMEAGTWRSPPSSSSASWRLRWPPSAIGATTSAQSRFQPLPIRDRRAKAPERRHCGSATAAERVVVGAFHRCKIGLDERERRKAGRSPRRERRAQLPPDRGAGGRSRACRQAPPTRPGPPRPAHDVFAHDTVARQHVCGEKTWPRRACHGKARKSPVIA